MIRIMKAGFLKSKRGYYHKNLSLTIYLPHWGEIAKHNLNSQKPQWNNLLGLASILITIMVLAFAPVYSTMGKADKDINDHYDEFINHIKDGHPEVQIEAIKQNDTDIRQNKDAIQKLRDDLKDLRAESIEDRGRFDERIKHLE